MKSFNKCQPFFSWRAAILNSDLSPITRHVLLTLGCHMNDLGESCYPSIELLAKETGLSERSVATHLRLAVSQSWITVSSHGFSGQGWRRHQYSISNPLLENAKGEEPLASRQSEKVRNLTTEGEEPDDIKVRNLVPTSTSVSTSENSPSTESDLEADIEAEMDEVPF